MYSPTQKLQSLLDGFGGKHNGKIEKSSSGFYYVDKARREYLGNDYYACMSIVKQLFI
jgi:hypothetical protein